MITALFQELLDELPEGTPLYLGTEYMAEHNAPPRIVMVPTTETYTMTAKPVGKDVSNLKPLWSRKTRISFYLWATGYDTIDGLIGDLATAINEVAPPAVFLEGSYEVAGWASAGIVYRFDVELETFVTKSETYVTIERVIGDCGISESLEV